MAVVWQHASSNHDTKSPRGKSSLYTRDSSSTIIRYRTFISYTPPVSYTVEKKDAVNIYTLLILTMESIHASNLIFLTEEVMNFITSYIYNPLEAYLNSGLLRPRPRRIFSL